MQFILDNRDIEKALQAHVQSLGINTTGCNVVIKVARKGDGHNATVDVTDAGDSPCELGNVQQELPLVNEDVVVSTNEPVASDVLEVNPDEIVTEPSDDQTMFT